MSKKSIYKISIFSLMFIALGLFIYRASIFRISKNFHEVDSGKFYRSAQLTPGEMQDMIDKYGIKTVISLRGAPESSYWVQPQREVLAKNNVKFYAFGWTIDYFPDRDQYLGFLEALKTAERPILVHCRTGADRTSTATALYAIEYMGSRWTASTVTARSSVSRRWRWVSPAPKSTAVAS